MKTYVGTPKEINNQFVGEVKAKLYNLEKCYECTIKEVKGNKTAEQRAKYWATCREYASKVGVSEYEIHNINLAELGIRELDADGNEIIELHDRDYNWKRDYYNHIQPSDEGLKTENGIMRIFYRLKSSEDLTTPEYARLIQILINNIIQDGLDNEINVDNVGG